MQIIHIELGQYEEAPYAFIEQGVYMLMTVLRGKMATKRSRELVRLLKRLKNRVEGGCRPEHIIVVGDYVGPGVMNITRARDPVLYLPLVGRLLAQLPLEPSSQVGCELRDKAPSSPLSGRFRQRLQVPS